MPHSLRLTVASVAATGLLTTVATVLCPAASARYPADVGGEPPSAGGVRDAATVLDGLTLRQRVGQLFMVGTPADDPDPDALADISRRHIGNIMLTGRSYSGTAVARRTADSAQARATAAATGKVDLLVATDQEGGLVQVLHGPGLSEMPTGLAQGRERPATLHENAIGWARQLARAGVNMNLGPVLDTVPGPGAAPSNPPVGVFDRELGFRPGPVARHGTALVTAMSAQGIVPTIKHFPGLGRVHANTDTSAGVTDHVTTRHDPYLIPFKASIAVGDPAVMMSTAYYRHLDPQNPAAFSPVIIRRLLRGDLGFRGVVISDDLADARQVSRWSYGARAVKFIDAGGDIVLTVDSATVPAMYAAVLTTALRDDSFRAEVNAAALRVLELKQEHGLL